MCEILIEKRKGKILKISNLGSELVQTFTFLKYILIYNKIVDKYFLIEGWTLGKKKRSKDELSMNYK